MYANPPAPSTTTTAAAMSRPILRGLFRVSLSTGMFPSRHAPGNRFRANDASRV